MRDLHWHPNANEWQYIINGTIDFGVFNGTGQVWGGSGGPGDVGYAPRGSGHYFINTGTVPVACLECSSLLWCTPPAGMPPEASHRPSRFAFECSLDASLIDVSCILVIYNTLHSDSDTVDVTAAGTLKDLTLPLASNAMSGHQLADIQMQSKRCHLLWLSKSCKTQARQNQIS